MTSAVAISSPLSDTPFSASAHSTDDSKGILSPLSSSSITIATLNGQRPSTEICNDKSHSSFIDFDRDALGIAPIAVASTETANHSRTDLAKQSLELPKINMRPASMDHSRIHGTQVDSAQPSPRSTTHEDDIEEYDATAAGELALTAPLTTQADSNTAAVAAKPSKLVRSATTEHQKPRTAAMSKSLDVPRTKHFESEGVLSREALKRGKAEDAIYGATGVGPARFQSLPRSFSSRIGLGSTLASRSRPGDLRYTIRPHPLYSEIVEVIDCEEHAPIYRKISRSSKSWRETFHEVGADEDDYAIPNGANLFDSDYELGATFSGSPAEFATTFETAYGGSRGGAGFDSAFSSAANIATGRGGRTMPAAAASCVTFQSVASSAGDQQYNAGGESVLATHHANTGFLSTASILHAATAQMSRAGSTGFGRSFDRGLLWEALAPYPNQFPLHIKDSRTVIDNVSLISMVLDRQHFCYRFQMGPNRMRWIAKRVRKHQLALLCYVRNTIIAEIFVNYEKGYSPYGSAPNA
ncbi:hypothetical protein FBU59_003771, partial [Linderina macrospora]